MLEHIAQQQEQRLQVRVQHAQLDIIVQVVQIKQHVVREHIAQQQQQRPQVHVQHAQLDIIVQVVRVK